MTKRIFRSIVAAALTVLLAALGLILGVLYSHFTNVQFQQLRVETALAAHAVTNEGLRYFDTLDDTMDCRITWIDTDGTVLYDNRSDTGRMENHLEREEVIGALESGYGQSSRYSATLMEQYLYAAERLPDGTVLRLASSHNSVLTLLLEMLEPTLLVVLAAILLSLVLANRLARHIVQPLNSLNLSVPMANTGYEEIRPLLHRLEIQQTQLLRQSRELEQMQKEFQSVTRALSEGLVLISAGGTILSINPAAAKLLEVTPNCAGADFSVANQNPEIAALVERALRGKKAEQTLPLPGGEYLAAATPVRSGEALSGAALFLLDVTQKRQAEKLRREFTANVSHELKTPLHAISGYAELMMSGMVQSQDIPHFSEKIYSEAQRLVQLVEDILRLSRLDEGAEDMQWAEVDLLAMAQSTVRDLASAAELSGVTLKAEGTSAMVRGIPQLLSGILFNLTDNAIKYNRPGGSVTVKVTTPGDKIRLTVADTGIGIPPEDRERIFERFYRVDKSRSKEVGGTGLGLSIVKHAVQILGAEIALTSTVGKGTAITVTFPKQYHS